jgi:hypothetical protein
LARFNKKIWNRISYFLGNVKKKIKKIEKKLLRMSLNILLCIGIHWDTLGYYVMLWDAMEYNGIVWDTMEYDECFGKLFNVLYLR